MKVTNVTNDDNVCSPLGHKFFIIPLSLNSVNIAPKCDLESCLRRFINVPDQLKISYVRDLCSCWMYLIFLH